VSGARFAGRRALVTGASRGIGAAVARRLAAEGADVAITARTLEHHPTLPGSLRETAARVERHGGRAVVVVADLSDTDHRARIVPEAVAGLGGPVDVLVNNAAAAIYQPLLGFPLRRRRLTFEVNVHAPLDLASAVAPSMVERGEGWIVNLSSAAAHHTSGPPFPEDGLGSAIGVYGASKAALDRLTNALAAELWGTGIRVNAVEPRSAVLSEGAAVLVGHLVDEAQLESMEDMVEAVVALCDCDPRTTGGVHVSLDLLDRWGLTVRSLDGEPLRRG
jgi:citronellol/citronellal dehydrogenase